MQSVLVGLVSDADNTLWDTNKVYADAQLWLLSRMETDFGLVFKEKNRLEYVREVDQAIAKIHHAGLRYPSELLVTALRRMLEGMKVEKAVRDAIHNVSRGEDARILAERFDSMLKTMPSLRNGVQSGLRRIRELDVPILVSTEGSLESCRARLEHWGLATFVNYVVSAPKSLELYERMANLLKLPTPKCIVVGDQLDRDILFSSRAGCTTIYFPSGFIPNWSPSISKAQPMYTVDSFDDVADIVFELVKKVI